MRKFLPQIYFITIFMLVIGFFAVPQVAHAEECGTFDVVCHIFGATDLLYGILGKIFWWGLIPLAGFVFRMLGAIMDASLALSLDGTFYNAKAIGLAWSVIRDIANMLFIFVLIYEGIKTVLNLGNLVTVRKTITSVILAAMFLNFSLFFTKVIIDVSNVAATWFMQGIVNVGGGASVSDSVRSVLRMEKLTSEYDGFTDRNDVSLESFTLGVILFVLMCVAIYVFFNVVFLIIGRIVAFIFLLITAPIGFVGALVPMLQEYSKKWWSELNNQAMMLPMFFLMVYLTLFIVDQMDTLLTAGTVASDKFDATNYVIFIIIIMMLLKALKVAEEYSGELGKMFGGLAKSATMFVGGVGFAATAGRAASALRSSEMVQNFAKNNQFAGRLALSGLNSVASAGLGAGSGYKGVLKATGLDKTGLKDNFKSTDSGYEGAVKDEIASEKEKMKLVKGENRKLARAEWLKSGGTGMMGYVLKGAASVGVPYAGDAAKALREAGGRPRAGGDLMKDKEVAKAKKEQSDAELKKLAETETDLKEQRRKALEAEAMAMASNNSEEMARQRKEVERLEAELASNVKKMEDARKNAKKDAENLADAERKKLLADAVKEEMESETKKPKEEKEESAPKEEPKK